MRRIICFILCLLFVISVISGCDTPVTPETETYPSTTDAVTEKEPEADNTVYISAKEYYNNGYSNNYIVSMDKQGRGFDASLIRTGRRGCFIIRPMTVCRYAVLCSF